MKIDYARVSTGGQTHNPRFDTLKAASCECIWTDTCSGSVPGDERLQFQAALEIARSGDNAGRLAAGLAR